MLPSATALMPDECQRMDAVIQSGIWGSYSTGEANQANGTRISTARSKPVLRIAADEEAVMREMVQDALARSKGD